VSVTIETGAGRPRGSIETRSFDFVPLDERHGQPDQMFYMWFGINANIIPLVAGFIGISLGLSFWWTLLAILIGNALGALFMAFHAAQGPQLGLPQMIQSRAQLGFYGAILPLAVAWIMYVAFLAIGIVLAGQGFQAVFGWSLTGWMIILTIPMLLLAIYGYDLIHRSQKYQTRLFIAVFLGLTVYLFVHGVPHGGLSAGKFRGGHFLLTLSVVASYQITYAPYVSDYSRYLPPSAAKKAFWRTYLATIISSAWLMALGAAIGALAPKSPSMVLETKHLGGPAGGALAILLAIGLIAPTSVNVYGGMMSALSIASNVSGKVRSTQRLRITGCIIMAVLGVLAATAGAGAFMTNLENYLTVILYILIPWSVINLVDYYVLRRGNDRTADFYNKNGSFGAINYKAMAVFLIAFAIEVPFMSTTIYEGPAAKALGGGDIAWIVGAVVTVPLYLLVMRGARVPRKAGKAGETAVPEAGR
jgi:nucleobase:cation symporter-1, NCS1 family